VVLTKTAPPSARTATPGAATKEPSGDSAARMASTTSARGSPLAERRATKLDWNPASGASKACGPSFSGPRASPARYTSPLCWSTLIDVTVASPSSARVQPTFGAPPLPPAPAPPDDVAPPPPAPAAPAPDAPLPVLDAASTVWKS
jgi:hypothetical protein